MENMTPWKAFSKCLEQNKRILELEDIISTDSQFSYCYARDIIKKPWKKGENTISKDYHYSYWYARDVIRGPWEKCHPIIFNSEYKNHYIDFLKSIKYDYSEWLI